VDGSGVLWQGWRDRQCSTLQTYPKLPKNAVLNCASATKHHYYRTCTRPDMRRPVSLRLPDIASSVEVAIPGRLPLVAVRHSPDLCRTSTSFLPPPLLHRCHNVPSSKRRRHILSTACQCSAHAAPRRHAHVAPACDGLLWGNLKTCTTRAGRSGLLRV
jgi:hypothetical protein